MLIVKRHEILCIIIKFLCRIEKITIICCCCCSPDSLKLGFRCSWRLEVRILWPFLMNVPLGTVESGMGHYKNHIGHYDIITRKGGKWNYTLPFL